MCADYYICVLIGSGSGAAMVGQGSAGAVWQEEGCGIHCVLGVSIYTCALVKQVIRAAAGAVWKEERCGIHCVLSVILLHMCLHTTTHVSSYYHMLKDEVYCVICARICTCVPGVSIYACVLVKQEGSQVAVRAFCRKKGCGTLRHRRILLYMCPHTTTYVSSYYYTCVCILAYICR
jgi:hypothetical protein